MSVRNFKRLGWAVASPEPGYYYKRVADSLLRVAADHDTSDLALRNAASILNQLANNPAAIRALDDSRRPGPKTSPKLDMAMDALAQLELEGPMRAKIAYDSVAQAWGVTAGAVKNVLTTHREAAARALECLINNEVIHPGAFRCQRKGSPPEYWTREELLRVVSLDLRDNNGCVQRTPRKKRATPQKSARKAKS